MPEMVLAGADGKPVIDASTGQAATMEELLRRRGLLAYGGNSRMMPLGAPTAAPVGAAAALAARAGGQANNAIDPATGQPIVAGTSGSSVGVPVDPSAVAAPVSDPSAVADASSGTMIDPSALLGMAVTGAGAGVAASMIKRRKKAPTITSPQFGAMTGPAPKPGAVANGSGNKGKVLKPEVGVPALPAPMMEGEFDEVNPLMKALSNRATRRALTRIR